ATPAGSSQSAPRRSDQAPKNGCTSDEAAVEASITTAASVYDSRKRSTMNGSSASSAPFAKSVAQCPAESTAIARLSSSARTEPRVAGPLRGGLRSRQVPVDQSVGELPLGPGELEPVPLERLGARAP